MAEKDIVIGKIVATYGHRGMLKVLPLTDFPDRFLDMRQVTLEQAGKQQDYTLTGARGQGRHMLVSFAEIPDMNSAETLKGALVKVAREDLVPLPEGSFYIFEIIGLQVYTPEGGCLGVVEDVIQTGANDVYLVDTGEKAPLLVPALKQVVRQIDPKAGRMVVDLSSMVDTDV